MAHISSQHIWRHLYNLLFIIAIPFILLRLYRRGRKAPDYHQRIRERFAYYPKTFKPGGIWLHAVSVGELMAARPLITKIMQECPHLPLTITTTTPTASAQVQKIFGDTVQHVYAPYDYSFAVQRFLNTFRPTLAIVMETEIWPNIFYYLQEKNIPLIIANARLADKSFAHYKKFKFFFAPILRSVTCIAAQSALDLQNFQELGASPEKMLMMGNIKYDVKVQEALVNKAHVLRSTWPARPVWIAASTHSVEEDLVVQQALAISKQYPDSLCIIAPRHPERFDLMGEKCVAEGLRMARYSQQEKVQADTQVLLADTLGELYFFYALSDVTVVFGSFAQIGGHNILEPAALGLPIIVGPDMSNSKAIAADFLAKDAMRQVTEVTLLPTLAELLHDKMLAKQMGERAHALVVANQGAVDKLWQQIEKIAGLQL